jgi:hypothetical protein
VEDRQPRRAEARRAAALPDLQRGFVWSADREGLLVPAEVLFEGIRGGNESLAVQRALGEWLTTGDELFFEAVRRKKSAGRSRSIATAPPANRRRP